MGSEAQLFLSNDVLLAGFFAWRFSSIQVHEMRQFRDTAKITFGGDASELPYYKNLSPEKYLFAMYVTAANFQTTILIKVSYGMTLRCSPQTFFVKLSVMKWDDIFSTLTFHQLQITQEIIQPVIRHVYS